MSKKGFTLVELIAVIALLSVIIVIAVPTIVSTRQNALNREDNNQINSIESAAIYYSQDTGVTTSITVETLLQNGYLEPTYKNGSNNCTETYGCLLRPSDNALLNSKVIQITKSGGKTKATYQE